jgi:hypothetical protein
MSLAKLAEIGRARQQQAKTYLITIFIFRFPGLRETSVSVGNLIHLVGKAIRAVVP